MVKEPVDPWLELRDQRDHFARGIRAATDKLISAGLAAAEILEDVFAKIPSAKDGDDGEIHLDKFNREIFERSLETAGEVYFMHAMLVLFDLPASMVTDTMKSFLARHRNLRLVGTPATPKAPGQA